MNTNSKVSKILTARAVVVGTVGLAAASTLALATGFGDPREAHVRRVHAPAHHDVIPVIVWAVFAGFMALGIALRCYVRLKHPELVKQLVQSKYWAYLCFALAARMLLMAALNPHAGVAWVYPISAALLVSAGVRTLLRSRRQDRDMPPPDANRLCG